MYDYQQALERSRTSLRQRSGWEEIHLAGQQWVVLPEVFSPAHTNSTRAHLDLLHEFLGGSFLEIGSGAGVIAVSAAQAGCDPVYATDISAAAVVNSRLNAERHGVARQVTCVHGDLFDALPTDIQQLAVRSYRLWLNDPQHPSLHFRRLQGISNRFTVRVGDHYRALGMLAGETITWVWIGTHAEYDRIVKSSF